MPCVLQELKGRNAFARTKLTPDKQLKIIFNCNFIAHEKIKHVVSIKKRKTKLAIFKKRELLLHFTHQPAEHS